MSYKRIPSDLLTRIAYDPKAKWGLVWVKPRWEKDVGKACSAIVRDKDGHRHMSHRLVWALHHGDPGDYQIDHKDRDRTNNTIGNLRLATPQQNQHNRTNYAGKSLFKGVGQHPNGRWRARLDGVVIGYYSTEEEAALAYNEAALKLHGEFAVLNNVK